MANRIMAVAAVASLFLLGVSESSYAAANKKHPEAQEWAHHGIIGTYDRAAVRRGFQVYREVCSSCHGVKYLAFRNLMEIGFTEDEAKEIAAEYEITDGPDDEGEMFERPGILADRLPLPFPNAEAAAASNNGVAPPDLSLMVKARKGGEDYLYAILTGYTDPPPPEELPKDSPLRDAENYNPYFNTKTGIAMPQPLEDESVEYEDGTKPTLDQLSRDVTTFLAWVAEPKLEERKRLGLKVIIFLIVLTGILYAVKRRVWSKLH